MFHFHLLWAAGVYEVRPFKVPDYLRVPGQVMAEGEVDILARTPGKVVSVQVEEGQRFEMGQTLIVFDQREVQAQQRAVQAEKRSLVQEVASLKADIEYAKAWKDRIEALFNGNAATKDELERANARLKGLLSKEEALTERLLALEAKEQEIGAILPYLEIKASEPGVVVKKLVKEGSHVFPGMPVLRLVIPKKGFSFVAELGEEYLTRIEQGMKGFIFFPKQKVIRETKISSVVKSLDEQTRTFRVKAMLEGEYTPGEFARLLIPLAERKAFLIPAKALIKKGGLEGVIVKDGKEELRVVRTGMMWIYGTKGLFPSEFSDETGSSELMVEILSGLTEGERIVLDH